MENTIRQISNSLAQPVVVTDPDGCVLFVNEAFTDMSGQKTEDLVGQKPGAVLQGPETSKITVEAIRHAIQAQTTFTGQILNYHADGHDYWVHLTITPIKDQAGELKYFVAFEQEIPSPHDSIHSICMLCKSMKESGTGSWLNNEEYLRKKLRLEISHGVCPNCAGKFLE